MTCHVQRYGFLPLVSALALALTLSSCGDGGGGNPATGTGPTPPSFTSATTASVGENASGTIYTAVASSTNGAPLAYSISGGFDAALFLITPAGALSFKVPPDFETPLDSNRDNAYEVVLSVSDGQNTASRALTITVTDSVSGGFAVRRVGTGFAAPVYLAPLSDNSGRVLVVERAGRIRILNPATGAIAATPFLDITGQVSTDGERGLLGLALAPDYGTSGRAYVYLTAPDGVIQLRRYTASAASKDVLDPASSDLLLTIPHPRSNHNGGWLGFDKAGLLYVAIGDGGGSGDPDGNGQNKSTLLGKILRLDVSKDDFPSDPNRDYGIPSANPYATSGGAPEVWLYGLRNPYRSSFDRATGDLWIGDVGQGAIEEIDRVQTTQAGLNLGWPLFEGTQGVPGANPAGITMPVTQYSHGSGPLQGASLIGGYVYRGSLEALQGLYIFGDFISNNVWSVPAAGLTQGTTTASSSFTNRNAAFTPDTGTLTSITSFGEDQSGELYIVTIGGNVFKIVPSG
ncbi:PQQ-dependent sugar dehydrogenase [Novosphingobium sp. PS1R-30]|uniref:PQQ-dependent sugar dehydrogenase n=1 Tax=Novosphingobium anseongense TaxID=3133436 RepID=A0ABU8RYE1_9SPHN